MKSSLTVLCLFLLVVGLLLTTSTGCDLVIQAGGGGGGYPVVYDYGYYEPAVVYDYSWYDYGYYDYWW